MEESEEWIAGHLHYHQDPAPALEKFVLPLVARLARDGRIRAFFFVRYALGGPHLRLRLAITDPGDRDEVIATMRGAADEFLAAHPSLSSWDAERIGGLNARILAGDPNESDAGIYPDNFFRSAPFLPEIERYGGRAAMAASLQMFCLSSIAALEFVARSGRASAGSRLAGAMRLLFFQALGFAAGFRELADLVRYGVDSFGSAAEKIVEKGRRVAESQADLLQKLALPPLFSSTHEARGEAEILFLGGRCLSLQLHDRDPGTRARIGGSQLHMTASRLGLDNIQEVYLSSLLGSALAAPETGARVDDLLRPSFAERDALAENPRHFLGQLVASSLASVPSIGSRS